MTDYIELPIENIIKEGVTTEPGLGEKKYVIYMQASNFREAIRINTYYIIDGDIVRLCQWYDRGLCNTMEEYEKMGLCEIENQAYGSWMDGAR